MHGVSKWRFVASAITFTLFACASSSGQILQISLIDQPNLCLDVYGGKADDGTKIDVWTCGGVKGQQFYFDAGTFKIRSVLDETKCVDAGDMKQGTPLVLNTCSLDKSQFWGYSSTSNTIYLYQSESDASMCMDVKDATYKDGTVVQNWACDGLGNQGWTVAVPKPPVKPFTIKVQDQNLCLDLYSQKTDNGTPIDVWTCSGGAGQQWLFETGSYKIQSVVDPNKCIDASDMKVRSTLRIWDCNGLKNQKWGYDTKAATIFLPESEADATNCMCLTDYKNGAPVQIYACNDQETEKWQLTEVPTVAAMEFEKMPVQSFVV